MQNRSSEPDCNKLSRSPELHQGATVTVTPASEHKKVKLRLKWNTNIQKERKIQLHKPERTTPRFGEISHMCEGVSACTCFVFSFVRVTPR